MIKIVRSLVWYVVLESSLIELQRSLFQLQSSPLQLESLLIRYRACYLIESSLYIWVSVNFAFHKKAFVWTYWQWRLMLISGKTDVTVFTWIYQNTNLAFQNINVTFFVKKKVWCIRVFPIFCHCPSVQKSFAIFLWKLICCHINRRHIFLVLNISTFNAW